MDINNKTLQALATAVNFRQMRMKLISSNIANAETPGYRAKRLSFEKALQGALDVNGEQAVKSNDSRHYKVGGGGISSLQPEIYEDPNDVVSENGNSVDVEDELIKLDENKMMHDAAIQLLNKKLALRKYILSSEK